MPTNNEGKFKTSEYESQLASHLWYLSVCCQTAFWYFFFFFFYLFVLYFNLTAIYSLCTCLITFNPRKLSKDKGMGVMAIFPKTKPTFKVHVSKHIPGIWSNVQRQSSNIVSANRGPVHHLQCHSTTQVPAAVKCTAVPPSLFPLPRLCICMWNSMGFVKSGCALCPVWCVPGEGRPWDNINATTEER